MEVDDKLSSGIKTAIQPLLDSAAIGLVVAVSTGIVEKLIATRFEEKSPKGDKELKPTNKETIVKANKETVGKEKKTAKSSKETCGTKKETIKKKTTTTVKKIDKGVTEKSTHANVKEIAAMINSKAALNKKA